MANPRKKVQGVLCGADSHQEWLLPWWWSRYTDHNVFDVAFCDFGMSKEARAWCEERGEVIDIVWDRDWIVSEDKISLQNEVIWKQYYAGGRFLSRQAWFKKPLALLSTPFQKTIWIDLDCEILASLSFLFDLCNREDFLGILREPADSHLSFFDPQIRYNSGVIIYSQDLSKMEKWAKEAIVSNEKFLGDDNLLSHLISLYKWEVFEIPETWNWRSSFGVNLNVKIAHWIGAGGKEIIRKTGGLKPLYDRFHCFKV